MNVTVGRALRRVRHAYSHFRVELRPFLCELTPGQQPRSARPLRWVWPSQLDRYPLPAATLRIVEQLRTTGARSIRTSCSGSPAA